MALILFKVAGGLKPILGYSGHKSGYILDRELIHHRAHKHKHTHYGEFGI